ncbi:MAG: hypothetical protein WAV79_01565 [Anaerolineae bacterium]
MPTHANHLRSIKTFPHLTQHITTWADPAAPTAEKVAYATLSAEDIAHYQRMVVALNETIRVMGEIDAVIEAHGGWPIRYVRPHHL